MTANMTAILVIISRKHPRIVHVLVTYQKKVPIALMQVSEILL
jgi:hypothetical protein